MIPILERLGNNVGRNVISFQRVPADPQQFNKHPDAIAQWVDACSFAMCPCDRNFTNRKAELSGQIEQFRIESPALDFLLREDCLCAAPGESLKPALRVFELQS